MNNPERSVLGKLAELEFEKECLKRNLTIAKPVIDNQVGWDYIVDFGNGLKKIQVKKIGRNTNNLGKEYKTIQLNGRRSYQKQDGSWKHSKWKYTEESYDFLVGIDLELDEMYLSVNNPEVADNDGKKYGEYIYGPFESDIAKLKAALGIE